MTSFVTLKDKPGTMRRAEEQIRKRFGVFIDVVDIDAKPSCPLAAVVTAAGFTALGNARTVDEELARWYGPDLAEHIGEGGLASHLFKYANAGLILSILLENTDRRGSQAHRQRFYLVPHMGNLLAAVSVAKLGGRVAAYAKLRAQARWDGADGR